MKKLFTLMASIVVSLTTTAFAIQTPPCGTQVLNADVSQAFTNGAVIALQCLDNAGGLGWYFNGAAPKSETFSKANLFRVETTEDGTQFKLKNVVNPVDYVGREPGNAAQPLVKAVVADDAVTFVAKTSNVKDAIRFKATPPSSAPFNNTNIYYLNTNDPALKPKYHTGEGGYSYWYVYKFTDEEVDVLLNGTPVVVTLNFTGINGESLTASINTYAGLDITDLLQANAPDFFTPTGVAEADHIISATNNTFTVTGTWDLPFTLNRVYRADLRRSSANDCTKWTVEKSTGKISTGTGNQNSTVNDVDREAFIPENLFYLKGYGYNDDNRLIVTLHSLSYDDNYGFTNGSGNNNVGTITTDPTRWYVASSDKSNDTDKGFSLQHSGNTNAFANDISNYLGVWDNGSTAQNDLGSFIRFLDLTESDFATETWTNDGITQELSQESRNTAKENPTSENVREIFFPDGTPTEWYRMLNQATNDDRDWSYLGYYPESGNTEWYIFNKNNGTRTELGKSDFLTCGNFAGERTGATQEQINGQLWGWVEGKGENAGKYCLVNKAYPKGAVSKKIKNNAGGEDATSGDNTSRWVYLESRKNEANDICWFDISNTVTVDGATYVSPTFENPDASKSTYIYFAIALMGQKHQLMRWSSDEASTHWLMTLADFDPVAEFEAALNNKGKSGFEAMKSLIGGAPLNATAPNATVPENVNTLAANALHPYAAQFDKKVVRVQNYRRQNQNNEKTWLGGADTNGSTTFDAIGTTTNGADLWLMLVNEENKVTLRSFANGHNVDKATNSTVHAGTIANSVMFLIGDQYMNFHQTNAGVAQWSASNDTGSMWYVTLAENAFVAPEAGEQYYRIVSDRWLVEAQSPNLAINGENRNDTGEGEVITRAGYGHLGNYWKVQAGSAEGSVKLVNLVDEYAMGGDGLAVQKETGNEYYLQALEGFGYAIKSADSTEGNIYLNVNASGETLGMTNNGAAAPAAGSNFSDVGTIYYFLPASTAEIENASTRYIDALKTRLNLTNVPNDTENIIALIGEEKAKDYIDAVNTVYTIAGVNKAKRDGLTMTNVNAAINAAANEIVSEHLGIQHIQFSTTKDTESWATRYLGLNTSNNLQGFTDHLDESTLWTIIPVENGYNLFNEQKQMYVGGKTGMNNNGASGHYPMVTKENAAVFTIGYNANFASFYLCEHPYNSSDDRAVIHMADNNGTIKNWNAMSNQNSHWYIHALKDAVCSAEVDGEYVTFTLSGELTDIANDNHMIISVTHYPDQPESIRRRAAANTTFEVQAVDINNNTFTLPKKSGIWQVSIPGGMVKTEDGHTRAASTYFSVAADNTVDIDEIETEAENVGVDVVYDLQGRRLAAPVKGFNIINGRKVFLR